MEISARGVKLGFVEYPTFVPLVTTNRLVYQSGCENIDISSKEPTFWQTHEKKIELTVVNAFAVLASPVTYAAAFTVGFILNALQLKLANKISEFIHKYESNKMVVTTVVGLLALKVAAARWVFAAANAFDMGRFAHTKLAEVFKTIGSSNSNVDDIEIKKKTSENEDENKISNPFVSNEKDPSFQDSIEEKEINDNNNSNNSSENK